MTWLVTGGAGYVGAHVVRAMSAAGHHVVVLDDLSTGYKDRVPDDVALIVGSVLDPVVVGTAIADHAVSGVVHLAGKKQVGESVAEPLYYYRENVEGLRVLLEAMMIHQLRRLVFSSSAAVYGMPDVEVISEDTPCAPLSPYGETKLADEWMVRSAALAVGFGYVNLRYFNVAGAAAPDLGDVGAFNLIPMAFERLSAGEAPVIFGADYPTPDGTCVRDYIHVEDVAAAHVAAARRLADDPAAALTVNAGRGLGVSVREVLAMVAEVTGDLTEPVVGPRRPGDPAKAVASAARIRAELGWQARHDLRSMVSSAWEAWGAR
jgi:UDP-glucose 4-epimerase